MFLKLFLKYIVFIRFFVSDFMRTFLRVVVPLVLLGVGLSGCTGFSTSSFPSFGFGGSDGSQSPDCGEIEKRMGIVHQKYASALSKEHAAIYLSFTGNLSKTMVKNRLRGLYQMTDTHLEDVVGRTQRACAKDNLAYAAMPGSRSSGASL